MFRTAVLYRWRFKAIGKRVLFGYLNSIKGYSYIEIGDNCSFGNNLRLEAVSGWGNQKYTPIIVFGNSVTINQNFHCTCARSIRIGDGTSITANCGIFDISHPYEDITVGPKEAQIIARPIRIGKDCLIGMNTVILPGTEIGNHCVVGANSTVSGVYPDYTVIVGSPAKIVKKYDLKQRQWIKL